MTAEQHDGQFPKLIYRNLTDRELYTEQKTSALGKLPRCLFIFPDEKSITIISSERPNKIWRYSRRGPLYRSVDSQLYTRPLLFSHAALALRVFPSASSVYSFVAWFYKVGTFVSRGWCEVEVLLFGFLLPLGFRVSFSQSAFTKKLYYHY